MSSLLIRQSTRWISPWIQSRLSREGIILSNAITNNMTTYAAVYHGNEYREALEGRHGQQLKLAWKEGYGKDDKKFDPFQEYKIISENEQHAIGDVPLSSNKIKGKNILDSHHDGEKEYKSDGRVIRPASLLASLNAGLPAGGNFAIVDLNGSQQKVTVDDLVIVNKLKPISDWAVGSVHTLSDENILLVGCSDLTLVGLPGVDGAEVDVMVEEITRDATVLVFKKRRRKHSKRKNGFRREVTFLRILDIRFPEKFKNVQYEKEKV